MTRKNIPKRLQAQVFTRDRFRCRYCASDVFFSPALKALAAQHRGRGYYDTHGHRDRMSKMLLDRCACVDHVVPVDAGGQNELENLVCACWACNLEKSNRRDAEWRERAARPSEHTPGWDGLLAVLRGLEPHSEWLRLFGE